MAKVSLTDEDYEVAAWRACSRIVGINQHRTHHEPYWDNNIRGALGEMAVAKWLHATWTAQELGELLLVNSFRTRGDIHGVEVRCTKHRDGHLIIYAGDPPGRHYVLVVGEGTEYEVVGYWPADRKFPKDCFHAERGKTRSAYWIPQSQLERPAKLKKLLRKVKGHGPT